jgi:hypothetical protein
MINLLKLVSKTAKLAGPDFRNAIRSAPGLIAVGEAGRTGSLNK